MAVLLITHIFRYIGTNAERVAMSTTGVKAGSTFFETDTITRYIFDGTDWYAGSMYGGLEG